MASLPERAERLRALHTPGQPLVLPNVWDAASAKVVVEAGFPALATTSSGVSAALGWADGEHTPPAEMFAAVARIARTLEVPLSADFEGGYGLPPDDFVRRMLQAGAVGCNLEDTNRAGGTAPLRDVDSHVEYLRAVKAAARAAGVNIVLNARVDVFIRQVGEPSERVAMAVDRARRYLQAGADCIFPFGVRDESAIVELVKGIPGPVNIFAAPEAPALARLAEIGVARISLAGRLHRSAMAHLQHEVQTISDALPSPARPG
jgi:2-methylisocitrate lyase-like PEP mutase family enzyme